MVAHGVRPGTSFDDGTLAPSAVAGSIPFAPEICLPTLDSIYRKYGEKLFRRYGFVNAFNPSFTGGTGNREGWFSENTYSTDSGMILLRFENYETGLIWNLMMQNNYITEGMKKAGFGE